MRACSRKRPMIERTTMLSLRPGTPGLRQHTPRMIRRMGTPAWEAWYSFFLEGVIAQAQDGLERSQAILMLQQTYRQRLLAAKAPKLRKAVRDAKRAGHAYVIIDGTLIPTGRVARDQPFYSGKHKKHGMNLQVIASPDGDILWVSGALPGSVHDKKAEWIRGVLDELERQGLVVLAGKGYQGSTWAKVPYKGKNKPEPQKEANRAHAKLRALGERANAQLKTWKILRKLRCCPWRAGQLAKAIHVLQIREA